MTGAPLVRIAATLDPASDPGLILVQATAIAESGCEERVGHGVLLALAGGRVGGLRDHLAGAVDGEVPVDGAVVGLHEGLHLAEDGGEVGDAASAAAEEVLERRTAERVGPLGALVTGVVTGVVGHASKLAGRRLTATGALRPG